MANVKVKRIKYKNGIRGLQSRAKSLDKQIRFGIGRAAGTYSNGAKVLDVATWNADGTKNIPSRNFFQKYFDDHYKRGTGQKHMPTVAGNAARKVLAGKMSATAAVKHIGNTGLELLRRIVIDWSIPPNAPSTVKKKGFNNPLIHTRKLLNSLAWWESKAKF